MAVFSYKGMDARGKKVSGIIDADNLKAARIKLRKLQIYPTSVNEGSSAASKSTSAGGKSRFNLQKYLNKVKVAELAQMTRQLSTLLNANVPLVDALGALVEQTDQEKLKSALGDIREKVKEGSRLASAMKLHPDVFGDLYINMVHAGEVSGALDTVLSRLADFTENQARLTSKVKGAMIYPVIMALVGIILMSFLLVFVVPKIVKIFEDAEATLPLPTRILIGVSDFIAGYWYLVIILVVGAFFLYKRYYATPKGRYKVDGLRLKMPVFGPIFRMMAVGRFCRTLSTLTNSGVQLMTGLDIVKGVVNNVVLTEAIEETRNSVKEGESIADPLKRSGQFPPMVTHMIRIGEKTGALEAMLERVADTYEEQVDTQVSSLQALMEPVMIVVMGGVVGAIVLSIILPILNMNKLIGQ
ncbi:MAG: type II secretion system inner membrane protein GspF [Deltaproteobacteria bacterium]|nr:type II secretion system inner membrane protein GspF [Deltaproteobacteria bacterium]